MIQFRKMAFVLLSICGILLAAPSVPVFAQQADPIVFNGMSEQKTPGLPVTLLVYQGAVYIPGQTENIVYFDQTVTDQTGQFCFAVSSAALPAVYTAQVKVAGETEARIYQAAEPPLFEDAFEEYAGGGREGWSLSNPATKYTAAQLDEAHGTSFGMKGESGNAAVAVCNFANCLPRDEVYRFSFSICSDATAPLFYLRLLDENWMKMNSANDPYMYESFYAGGNRLGYYNGSQNWRQNKLLDWQANRWYHIEIWLDAVGERIDYAVDGVLLGGTDFVFERDWKGFALLQEGTSNTIYLDDIKVEKAGWAARKRWLVSGAAVPQRLSYPIMAGVSTDNIGNIFFDDEQVSFCLRLKNQEETEHSGQYRIAVLDEAGTEVWCRTEPVTLSALSELELVFQPQLGAYGTYALEVSEGETLLCSARLTRSVRSGEKNEEIGVCAHFDRAGGDVTSCMELLEAAGFGYVRTDWRRPESSPGLFTDYFETDPRFSVYIRESDQRRIGMLALIGVRSSLYPEYTSEQALSALTEYCRWLAEKCKGRVTWFEIANEPDALKSDNTPTIPCEDYVKLLKAAYQGIKAGNPDAKVIAFAATTIAQQAAEDYLRTGLSLMKQEGFYWFDAISVHPYHIGFAPEVKDPYMRGKTWLDQGQDLQAMIQEYNLEDKELWATETGYHTSVGSSYTCKTETEAAAYLVRMLALNKAYGLYDKLFFYDLQNDGTDLGYSEHNYGLLHCWKGVDTPFAAKAAYPAIAFWNALMDGAHAKGITEDDGVYWADFSNGGSSISVLWDTKGRGQQMEYIAQNPAAVYDMYGNLLQHIGVGESTVLKPDTGPVYVVAIPQERFSVTCNGVEVQNCAALDTGAELLLVCRPGTGEKGCFLAAKYRQGNFVDCALVAVGSDRIAKMEWIYDGSYDEIQLMLWDGLGTMRPLAAARRI